MFDNNLTGVLYTIATIVTPTILALLVVMLTTKLLAESGVPEELIALGSLVLSPLLGFW